MFISTFIAQNSEQVVFGISQICSFEMKNEVTESKYRTDKSIG